MWNVFSTDVLIGVLIVKYNTVKPTGAITSRKRPLRLDILGGRLREVRLELSLPLTPLLLNSSLLLTKTPFSSRGKITQL